MSKLSRFYVENRSEVKGNTLTGYAATFGTVARLPQHYERMAPTSFDAALKRDNVMAFYQHNPELLLGSVGSGNLRLSTDSTGLHYELELPDVSYAHDVRELVAKGVLTGMSFGFLPGDDSWDRAPDGRQIRTHESIERLLEISPVSLPAYEGTSVALRAIEFEVVPINNNKSRLVKIRAAILFGGI